jgi:hypothetical protein
MSEQLRFYAVLRGHNQVRKIEMDATTAASVSSRFNEMKAGLLPAHVEKKKYKPLAAIADDDEETVLFAKFDLPEELQDLSDKGDVPGPLTKEDLLAGRVRAIVALPQTTKHPLYLFQGVDRRNVLLPGLALFMSADTFQQRKEPALILGNRIHAAWQDGELLFVRESDARKVVDFWSVFEPATDHQLQLLADNESISCDSAWLKSEATTFYRRRIAAVLASKILHNYSVDQLQDAAKTVKFKLPVKTANGVTKIVLDQDKKKLKQVLQFLSEDVYSSPITQGIFCAAGKSEFEPD